MSGLSQKVTRGVFDPLPSNYSADLSNIIKNCLQVDPTKRPSCDKLLATPGLLNHLTGTLKELDEEVGSSVNTAENLLSTIRCPRNLGMITERLPKPQYNQLKRSNSMAIETH